MIDRETRGRSDSLLPNLRSVVSVLMILGLSACGGSGGSDPSTDTPPPTSVSVAKSIVGKISGFGSVYVNGVEFDTTGTSYEIDDETASDDSALAVGMVVKVDGSVSADGLTGSASSISYDDELEGRVENLMSDPDDSSIKIFTIMNTTVRVDQNSTNFDGEDDVDFDFDTILNGDNVEVSGEYDGDVLLASYIEKQDSEDDDFEVKGTVTSYNGSDQFELSLRNASTLEVTLAAGASIPFAGIQDGQFVEVEGTIPDPVASPDSLLATKVELEDDDRFEDNDDVEIKGILGYDDATDTWSVRDVAIAFDESTTYEPESLRAAIDDKSAAGLTVEVEGDYLNGSLQVSTIELEEDELEFEGDASLINANSSRDGIIRLSFGNATGTIDIVVNSGTLFVDDEAMNRFDLTALSDLTKVEIDARWADDGSIIASSLHLEDDGGYELTGPVDAIDDVSISVLGVTFSIDGSTLFEDGIPGIGDTVEIEDENGDGFADSVEIEDDD